MKMNKNISKTGEESESLPPILEKMKLEDHGLKVPFGYFDSLSPRIMDEIKQREEKPSSGILTPVFSKPKVWAPVMAISIIAVVLIIFIPKTKNAIAPITDEWTELNMVYDISYAEEAFLFESQTLEKEIENSPALNIESLAYSTEIQPTETEIAEYLKSQELDNELLTEK